MEYIADTFNKPTKLLPELTEASIKQFLKERELLETKVSEHLLPLNLSYELTDSGIKHFLDDWNHAVEQYSGLEAAVEATQPQKGYAYAIDQFNATKKREETGIEYVGDCGQLLEATPERELLETKVREHFAHKYSYLSSKNVDQYLSLASDYELQLIVKPLEATQPQEGYYASDQFNAVKKCEETGIEYVGDCERTRELFNHTIELCDQSVLSDEDLRQITETNRQKRLDPDGGIFEPCEWSTIDTVILSIDDAYDLYDFEPDVATRDEWKIMQLEALLDNILVDNPHLEAYYKDFADTLLSQ